MAGSISGLPSSKRGLNPMPRSSKIDSENRPNRPIFPEDDMQEDYPTREEYEREMHFDRLTAEAERLEFEGWVRSMEEAFGDVDCPF